MLKCMWCVSRSQLRVFGVVYEALYRTFPAPRLIFLCLKVTFQPVYMEQFLYMMPACQMRLPATELICLLCYNKAPGSRWTIKNCHSLTDILKDRS